MAKNVFIIKEKLCQSFWQLVKAFRFEATKIKGRSVRPPPPLPGGFLGLINDV